MEYASSDTVTRWVLGDRTLARTASWIALGYGRSRDKAAALRPLLPSHTPCGRVVTVKGLTPLMVQMSAWDRPRRAETLRAFVGLLQGLPVPHPSEFA